MPKANAIDLAKTLRKLKTGNFEFFHILTFGARWVTLSINISTFRFFNCIMDDNQLNVFKTAFQEANNGLINFPEKFYVDKINEIELYTEGMRGGRKVRFFVQRNEMGNWYLDLFASTDTHSWHKRIEQDGTIKKLESYMGEFGRPYYPDDPERTKRECDEIQANNDRVHSILVKKGLERNFDNIEFEKQNVVRLDYKQNS